MADYERFYKVLRKHQIQLSEFQKIPANKWGLQSQQWHRDFKEAKIRVAQLESFVRGLKPTVIYG